MNRIVQAIEHIQALTGALVDSNYLQGREMVLAQLHVRSRGRINELAEADEFISDSQTALLEIKSHVMPFQLPNDYIFFLEFCGGLLIKTERYNLMIDGIGPMVEEWYGYPLGDDGRYENGLFLIALINFKKEQSGKYVFFLLDLAGVIKQDSVIALTSWGDSELLHIMKDIGEYTDYWIKLSDSFTQWLEMVAKTNGTLGFLEL